MKSAGISVIIPAYNAASYLGEAIDSALAQTLRPSQIIVVDDGSADDTLAVARGYGDAVTVLPQPNRGASAARNLGLDEATQPLIAFLDADDRWGPNKMQLQFELLEADPSAMLCICRVCDFWSPDLPLSARRPMKLEPVFRPGQVTTWLARRELFDRNGRFDETEKFKFTEGSELYSRFESTGVTVLRTEACLVDRRLHAFNKTNNSAAHYGGILQLMKRRLELKRGSA